MSSARRTTVERDSGRRLLRVTMLLVLVFAGVSVLLMNLSETPPRPASDGEVRPSNGQAGLAGSTAANLHVYWEVENFGGVEFQPTTDASNIYRKDYVGPDACRECHKSQYQDWTTHSHRRMNAVATESTVKGDFSGNAEITYQGARGQFLKSGDRYLMRITQDERTMVYDIHQTIGSRFFQYYIGVLADGIAPEGHTRHRLNHVLPFGYWLEQKMWVPIVHMFLELPDEGGRWNPLDPPRVVSGKPDDLNYAESCSICHTTQPLGDVMIRDAPLVGDFAPVPMFLSARGYLREQYPDVLSSVLSSTIDDPLELFNSSAENLSVIPAAKRSVTLGISCEACHLGCRAHAEKKRKTPSFLASGDHLYYADYATVPDSGRTPPNLNWVCSRCHNGTRPYFAAGMSTWNSTEFSDAARGACYTQLTCVKCHNPHKGIGPRWTRSLQQDDSVCLNCHAKFMEPDQRLTHTRHTAGSEGDSCINCHMPKLNEGMQDVVRTHMIYSPTQPEMIEKGHPNACNLCHLDKPIDWTLQYLQAWYGKDFLDTHIDRNYPDRDAPVGRIWLTHKHESVRLVATDTASRQSARWALPEIIDQLDDPYLLNRQFALMAVERMLDIKLSDFGYQFYMTRAERQKPLRLIRKHSDRNDDAAAADSVVK